MNRNHFKRIRAVLFDWAGTLVDHGSLAPVQVFSDVFRSQGISLSVEEIRSSMGMAKREHIASILSETGVQDRWMDRFGERPDNRAVDRLYAEFLEEQEFVIRERSNFLPGVLPLLETLVSAGLCIGSTTGYPREAGEVLRESARLQGFEPSCIVTASDVQAGRPAPWMIFRACEMLGVYPMKGVVNVDDTVSGVMAARNAGCWSIGVSRTGNHVGLCEREFFELDVEEQRALTAQAEAVLREAGAHFVVSSVSELEPVLQQVDALELP